MSGEDDRRRGYRVFISSTYLDNRERREQVRKAIERAGMVAVGMERFEATDQPTVEDCRQRAAGCDIFVGIIAHRYGWEPEGQPAGQEKSITWLEYEAAREAGRPRLMFEVDPDAPFRRGEMDAGPDRHRKAERLEEFKAEYAKDQRPAFFGELDLQAVVLDSLVKWRERHEGPRVPAVPVENAGSGDDLDAYREALLKEHGTLHLAGFRTKLRVPIDLTELYVPLAALPDLRGHGEAAHADGTTAERLLREGHQPEISLHEAFRFAARLKPGRRGLVILGEPGSGKTTHVKRLLLWCLKEGSESLGLEAGLVPVFLPLRRLEDSDRTVHGFIEQQLDACPGVRAGFGKALLSKARLLLLFDGLDEVVDPERRAEVAGWIDKLAAEGRSGAVAVVTCRFAGYGPQGSGRSEVRLGAGFLELAVRPLDRPQRNDFIKNWYRVVEGGLTADPAQAEKVARERSAALISTLESPDFRAARVAEMVGNPLLLTNLCLVHRDRGRLPRDRARLYKECVEVLLELWRESKELPVAVSAAQGLRALQPVALWLHEQKGRTRASAAELRKSLEPALEAARWDGGGPEEFLRAVKDESGLLTGWGPDKFSFMHLGFQEYLAACEVRRMALLSAGDRRAVLESLARRYGDSWWQEVLLLLVGEGNPSLFEPLMRAVVDQPAFAGHPELLALLLEESSEKPVPGPFVALVQRRPRRFRWPWEGRSGQDDGELWERQRVALDVLRRIGADKELRELSSKVSQHPSPEIRRWLEQWRRESRGIVVSEKGGIEAVSLPGGKFVMGSPKTEVGRYFNEDQREVKVEPFLLGRYPVTNEQYARFLKENPGRQEPGYWADRRFNQAQQPVVGVSWGDAMAFAEWAGGRLPTEAEWEYACRAGTTTATYTGNLTREDWDPVLDSIAWYSGNSGGQPRTVGQKAPNMWGLYDMLGNVYEWCSDGAGSNRLSRGGSWLSDARLVRAARRSASPPGHRFGDLGFRWARGQAVQAQPGRSPAAAEPP